MCRFEMRDLVHFFTIVLPFGAISISGMLRGGYGWYLLPWLGYALLFFFLWEARVLCRHCPFWAQNGSTLHCPANYGVIKIWKYEPGPMTRAEKIQFIAGALLLLAYPFVFLLLGGEYLLAGIGAITAGAGVYILRKNVCSRCINFSCPMNAVPKRLVDIYLVRNPRIRAAWEAKGYRLGTTA
jgi:hypothetical protein